LLRLRLAFLLVPVFLAAQSARNSEPHKLLIVSIAGLDERFLLESTARVKIPNIRKLLRTGAAASGVVGVAPSDTWPSAMSLVSGVPPSETRGAIPLWQVAGRNGLKTASVYWPDTAGAEIGFDFPAAAESQKDRTIRFDTVARRASPAGIADQIEKTSPGFEKPLWDDKSAAQAAAFLLRNEKPDLLLVQFTDVESEQRETGALSVYARDMLENDDELIGQILRATAPGTIVAIVSGHGFENENYIVRPRVLLKQGKQAAAGVPVDVEAGLIGTADPTAAGRLRKLMMDGHRHGLAREVPMAEVRARASSALWPDIANWTAAFDTPLNYVASADDRGPALGPGTHHGVSGLWPTRPGYRSVFVIAGEGIRPRKLGEIDLLQIAPTLAGVIGVTLPQAKKDSLWPSISR
jgi:predicted AlkP superfamily pyrophosphatase or phosphodiesterase